MKKVLLISLLTCTLLSFGQTTPSITGPFEQFGDNVNLSSAGYTYRVSQFLIEGNSFNGDLLVSHSVVPPNLVRCDNVTIYLGGEIDAGLLATNAFNETTDPNGTAGWLENVTIAPLTLLGSLNTFPNTNFDPSSFLPYGTSLIGVNLPQSRYVYVVETFEVECYTGVVNGLASTIQLQLGTTGSSITKSGTINLNVITPVWEVSSMVASTQAQAPSNTQALNGTMGDASLGLCMIPPVQRFSRRTTYTMLSGLYTDPYFTLDLNTSNPDFACLAEVDPNDVRLSFHLILENGDILEATDVPLTAIQAAYMSGSKTNSMGAAVQAQTPGPFTSLVLAGSAFPILGNPPANEWFETSVTFVPTLADATGDGKVSRINLHLSKLTIPAIYSSPGQEIQTNYLSNGFITLQEGSYIIVDYIGEFVPWEFIDANFDGSPLKGNAPFENIQVANLLGFNSCGQLFPQSGNFVDDQNYAVRSTQALTASAPLILEGDQDIDPATWNGQQAPLTVLLSDISRNQENSEIAALPYDYACSYLEFEIEMEEGLAVICPNSVLNSSSITYENCSGAINFGGGTVDYYAGMNISPGNLCSTVNSSPLEAGDLVWIDYANGTEIIEATALSIRSRTAVCEEGQIWTVRFPMSEFAAQSASGSILLLDNAVLRIQAQSYCPASEPKTPYRVRSYILPGKCIGGTTTYPPSGNNSYDNIACSNGMCPDLCPKDRFLVGSSNAPEITITCPGCLTPGAMVRPLLVPIQRHADFIGFKDSNNDGLADDYNQGAAPLIPADTNEINRTLVRHGDVATMDFHVETYDPPISNQNDVFNLDDLANINNEPCPTQPIILDNYVVDISGEGPGNELFSSMFCPLISGVTTGTESLLDYNEDFIEENGITGYTSLGDGYPSKVTFIIPDPNIPGQEISATTDIPVDRVAWVSNKMYRVVIPYSLLITAFADSGITNLGNVTRFDNDVVLKFHLNFVTDVDVHPYEWGPNFIQTGIGMGFNHKAYLTDLSLTSLLDPGFINEVPDHEILLCDNQVGKSWWCEIGEGAITVAPYTEMRYMRNQYNSLGAAETSIKSMMTGFAEFSPCAEMGPICDYRAGQLLKNLGSSSGYSLLPHSSNLFPREIRYPALPDTINLYVPEPFLPEGIIMYNETTNPESRYAPGSNSSADIRMLVPLEVGGTNSMGITVTPGHLMPDAFFPVYPDMAVGTSQFTNAAGPLNGGGVSPGQLIFDDDLVNKVPHYKISIPIGLVYDKTFFAGYGSENSQGVRFVPPGDLPTGNQMPIYVADESLLLIFAPIYSMPSCSGASQGSGIAPDYYDPYALSTYEEEVNHYMGNTNMLYFDGRPENLLHIMTPNQSIQTLQPILSGVPVNSDFGIDRIFHPKFDTKLLMPNRILSRNLEFASTTTPSINSKVKGVSNHVLDFSVFNATPAEEVTLKQQFSGAIPAIGDPSYAGAHTAFQQIPNVYYDQRSDMEMAVQGTSTPSIDPISGDFSFQVRITNEHLEMLHAFAAPEEFDPGSSISSFAQANSSTIFRNMAWASKNNIDLNNLYFYLNSIGNNFGGTQVELNMATDVFISSVSLANPQWPSVSYTLPMNGGEPLIAVGETPNDPRLFQVARLPMPMVANGIPIDYVNNGSILTVTGRFNCDRPEIQDWLQLANELMLTEQLELPFDVVLNYNCDKTKQPWNGSNAPSFYNSVPYSLQSPSGVNFPITELTYADAMESRCHNDIVINTPITLIPPQVGFEITLAVLNPGPCNPEYQLLIENNSAGIITLQDLNLSGFPIEYAYPASIGSDWTQQGGGMYDFTGISPLTLSAGDIISYTISPDVTGCVNTPFDLEVEISASSYCADCSGGCNTFSRTKTLTVTPDVFGGIPDYSQFSCAQDPVFGPGNQMTVYLDPASNPTAALASTTFNFLVNGISVTETVPLGGSLTNLLIDVSSINVDPCANIVVSLESVATTIVCNSFSCDDQQNGLNISCTIPYMPMVVTGVVSTINCEGSIDITVTGGTPQLAYSWSNGSMNEDLFNLPSGTYTVTVTDGLLCTISEVFTVVGGVFIDVDPLGNVSQCGSYVLPTITGTGLSGNEAYYTGPNGTGTQYAAGTTINSNVTLYIYDVDAQNPGCYDEEIFTIALVPETVINNTITSCGSYEIQGGIADGTIITTSGLYTYTSGYPSCITENWDITIFTAPTPVISSLTNMVCYDVNPCTGAVIIDGGQPNLNYTLYDNGGVFQESNATGIFDELCPGDYTVVVVIADIGCPVTLAFTIEGSSMPIEGSALVEQVCNVDENGFIDLTVTGGTMPYIYEWQNADGDIVGTNQDLISGVGTYTVTITDYLGCEIVQTYSINLIGIESFEVIQSAPGSCIYDFTNVVLNGGIPASTSGWVVSTEWVITPPSATTIVAGNPIDITYDFGQSGTYQVCLNMTLNVNGVICDASYCASVEVECIDCDLLNPTFTFASSSVSGTFLFTGNAQSTVPGSQLFYSWSWGDGLPNTTFSQIGSESHFYTQSGIYTACLTVNEIFEGNVVCSDTICQTIMVCKQGSGGMAPCAPVNFMTQSTGNGTLQFNAITLNPAWTYTYYWDFGDGAVNTSNQPVVTHFYSAPGSYLVTLIVQMVNQTTGATCSVCRTKKVLVKVGVEVGAQISVYPNPTDGSVTLRSEENYSGMVDVLVYNEWGVLVLNESRRYETEISINLMNLLSGMYFIGLQCEEFSLIGRVVKMD